LEKITERTSMTDRPRLTPEVADARRAVRDFLERQNLKPGSVILLAVSGGGDSMALAAAAAFEAPKLSLIPGAVIVDHGLQDGSDQVAQTAANTCEQLGLAPVIISKVQVEQTGEGMEAAARDARFRAIEKARIEQGAELVLLAHNLEDQAETVLLGLARGSGLSSISGMDAFDPARNIGRPFLNLTRDSLRKSCSDQGIRYWDDPQNSDSKFARVRVRNLLVELESALGPGFAKALSRTAAQAADADDVITGLAAELSAKAKAETSARSVSYRVDDLVTADRAVRTKALFLICQRAGAKNISAVQVEQVEELVTNWHGQKSAHLSGITVERVKDLLVFRASASLNPGAC
jgi:tRNA(Ile)-lysidine synthase